MEGTINSYTLQRVVQDHDSPGVDKNTFKQMFQDHWETFKGTYPRFATPRL